MAHTWLQEALSADSVLRIEEGAKAGGVSDDEHIARIRDWLRAGLSHEEQQALCRLWMFKSGFELAAAQAMLGSSNLMTVKATLRGLKDTSCLQLSTLPGGDSSAARYSMHALVLELFKGEFGRLAEANQISILETFLEVMVDRADDRVDNEQHLQACQSWRADRMDRLGDTPGSLSLMKRYSAMSTSVAVAVGVLADLRQLNITLRSNPAPSAALCDLLSSLGDVMQLIEVQLVRMSADQNKCLEVMSNNSKNQMDKSMSVIRYIR